MEVNVLKPNKQTFNKAIIVFDSFKIARSWLDVLISKNIPHTTYIVSKNGSFYYGFKMWKIKNCFFELCMEADNILGGD